MIAPHETLLTGKWVSGHNGVVPDETCERIATLVDTYLAKIRSDSTGWDSLYRDPHDGRYWELVYPHSELHGGGPPELRNISPQQASQKYGPIP